jgi:nucleotide-binding universal stress UspA family protein
MANCLLILSSTRSADKSIARALEIAQGGALSALFVVDNEAPQNLSRHLSGLGFTGSRPKGEVTGVLKAEYHRRGEHLLSQVLKAASELRVPCSTQISVGDFVDECLRVIKQQSITHVVVSHKKKSHMSRYLFGSSVESLQAEVDCPIEIVEEEA